MKDKMNIITWGVSLAIIFVTYLSVAQGWGVKTIESKVVMKKYRGKSGYYGRENKVLRDSVLAVQRQIRDSLRKRRKDSIKKVEIQFNKTRDSVKKKFGSEFLKVYDGGKYLYAYGKAPRYSSDSYSYSSSGYSSSSSSGGVGSFRGGSSRSFRGGSRRGGK